MCPKKRGLPLTKIGQVVCLCVAFDTYLGWDVKPMHWGFNRLNEGLCQSKGLHGLLALVIVSCAQFTPIVGLAFIGWN